MSTKFKLVPLEPTEKMISAAGMGWEIRQAELSKRLRAYQAMVSAAPDNNSLAPVVEKFNHLDAVLRSCEKSEDVIYRTCAELWVAICEYQKRAYDR